MASSTEQDIPASDNVTANNSVNKNTQDGHRLSPAGSLHTINTDNKNIKTTLSESSTSSNSQSQDEDGYSPEDGDDAVRDKKLKEPEDKVNPEQENTTDQGNPNTITAGTIPFLVEESNEEQNNLNTSQEGKGGAQVFVNGVPWTDAPNKEKDDYTTEPGSPSTVISNGENGGHFPNNNDEHPTNDWSSWWTRAVLRLHRGITRRFLQPVARIAATYPRVVLIALALLSVGMMVAGVLTNFQVENETHLLWPPYSSLSVEHSDWLYDVSHFNYAPVEIEILVHANGFGHDGDSSSQWNNGVLSQQGVQRVFDILETVTKIEGYQQGCDFAETFGDFYSVGQCSITSVADFWNQSRAFFDTEVATDEDAIRAMSTPNYPTGVLVDITQILGNSKYADEQSERQRQRQLFFWEFDGIIPLDDNNGIDDDDDGMKKSDNSTTNNTIIVTDNESDPETVDSSTTVPSYETSSTSSPTEALPEINLLTSADSFLIRFDIPWSNVTRTFEASAVEELLALRKRWETLYPEGSDEYIPFRLEIVSQSSYEDEFMRSIVEDLWLMPIAAAIVGAFTIFFAFGKWDRVQSRGLLGLGSVATIVGSIMTTFGLLFIIGVPFTTNTLMLPFLMFGIGLDDAFIIYGSYHRKQSQTAADIPKRIDATMEDVGVSIFLTSLTSMLAFILGSFSSIPAVRWLCLYAFPCIGIDFLYQITFFIALIVLDEQRIQDNRMDYLTCIRVEREVPTVEPEPYLESQQQLRESGKHEQGHTEKQAIRGTTNTEDTVQHPADRIMGWFAVQILKGWFQCLSLMLFAALSVASIYFATKLEQQFDFTDTVPHDSYLKAYYSSLSRYTETSGVHSNAYFRDVDQSDPAIQQQMLAYMDDLIADGNVDRPAYFWLLDFKTFVTDREQEDLFFGNMTFEEQMDDFLSVPIYQTLYKEAIGREFSGPVGGRVWETRCNIHINVDRQDSKATVDMLANLRSISGQQPINQDVDDWRFFTYDNVYHLYE